MTGSGCGHVEMLLLQSAKRGDFRGFWVEVVNFRIFYQDFLWDRLWNMIKDWPRVHSTMTAFVELGHTCFCIFELYWTVTCLWIPRVQPRAGHRGEKCVLNLVVGMNVLLVNRKAETSFWTSLGKTSQRQGENLHPVSSFSSLEAYIPDMWPLCSSTGGCEKGWLAMLSLFKDAVADGTKFLYLLIPRGRNLSFQSVTIGIIYSQRISPMPTFNQARCLLRALQELKMALMWNFNVHSANFPQAHGNTEPNQTWSTAPSMLESVSKHLWDQLWWKPLP